MLIKHVGLENLGFCVHSGLKIFICMECEVAIIPESILGHLKHQHRRELSKKSKSAIKATISGFVQRFDMPAKATEVVSPAFDGPPVKEIKIEEGYECTFPSCDYAAKSQRTIVNHWSDKHRKAPKAQGTQESRECKVQTLFFPHPCWYFTVEP